MQEQYPYGYTFVLWLVQCIIHFSLNRESLYIKIFNTSKYLFVISNNFYLFLNHVNYVSLSKNILDFSGVTLRIISMFYFLEVLFHSEPLNKSKNTELNEGFCVHGSFFRIKYSCLQAIGIHSYVSIQHSLLMFFSMLFFALWTEFYCQINK